MHAEALASVLYCQLREEPLQDRHIGEEALRVGLGLGITGIDAIDYRGSELIVGRRG